MLYWLYSSAVFTTQQMKTH